MYAKRLVLSLILLTSFSGFVFAEVQDASNIPELLLFQELPKVITASKTAQSVETATSIMTVITESDIARSGARTIYEVLKRVPGFFPTSQATWMLVGSRGLISDGNDHILLLIDGHVQNSIVGQGYQQQDMIPTLENVKQIEIIRGPGSVLWGSNAVYGIINIITKDGAKNGGTKVTGGYGHADGMFNANYLYSFGVSDDVKGVLSLNYWQSEGFNRSGKDRNKSAWNKDDAADVKSNVEFPWGMDGSWPPLDKQREGYEMYLKMQVGAGELLGRILETNVVYPWDTWQTTAGSDLSSRKTYLEYRQKSQWFDNFLTLNSSFYGDLLLQNRFPSDTTLFNSQATRKQDQSNEELAFGTEFTGDMTLFQGNALKTGIKAVRTKIGPNRDTRFNAYQNNEDTGSLTPATNTHIGVESGFDNNLAAYFEDQQKLFNDQTTVFVGGRFDWDDFRENKGVFLPRGGIIQSLFSDFTMKYVLNTGYLRPEAVYSKTVGIIVDQQRGPTQGILRVDKSEQVISHDLQVYWKKERTYAAVTAFYETIKDYISFDANFTPQGYKNVGEVYTKGVEFETRYQILDNLYASGNYSYALAKITRNENINPGAVSNDRDVFLNYPQQIFNIGVDYLINANNSVNVNFNGWAKMPYVRSIATANTYGEFDELAGEQYLDFTFTSTKIFGTGLDLTIFAFNLLDNTDKVGMAVNNGVWYPRGRDLGAKLSYMF